MKVHWNFLGGGGGCKTKKNFCGGSMDIFWNWSFVTEAFFFFFFFFFFSSFCPSLQSYCNLFINSVFNFWKLFLVNLEPKEINMEIVFEKELIWTLSVHHVTFTCTSTQGSKLNFLKVAFGHPFMIKRLTGKCINFGHHHCILNEVENCCPLLSQSKSRSIWCCIPQSQTNRLFCSSNELRELTLQ